MPAPQGLYDPAYDKDSCGVGFIADIKGRKSHKIVEDAIDILCNLEHRGAVGADPRAGDGAGILVQTPHAFFRRKAGELGITLPEPGHYAVGVVFMPHDPEWRKVILDIYAEKVPQEGLVLLGWREVPHDNSSLGESVKPTEPFHMQVFIARGSSIATEDEFERKLYILRKVISDVVYRRRERRLSNYYVVSLSCRTVIYKGMFLADQLGKYYPDLHEPDFETALCLVHQRCAATSTGWRRGRPRSRRSCSATTSPSCGRSPTRASPTPPVSTMRSSS
jgi:glutamate synthase (NADPH/NADH) large chain